MKIPENVMSHPILSVNIMKISWTRDTGFVTRPQGQPDTMRGRCQYYASFIVIDRFYYGFQEIMSPLLSELQDRG